jgi:hypothetical protein
MNSLYVLVADFFAEEIAGGGELNNEELFQTMGSLGREVIKVKSQDLTIELMRLLKKKKKSVKYIVSNFIFLNESVKKNLYNKDYVIYEHDHKYVDNRNPAVFKDFLAPKENIVNFDFYKNAKAVLCQSNFHAGIVRKNLELDNIVSLSGNLWSTDVLSKIRKLAKKEKSDKFSIMDSNIPHKNTYDAVRYCKANEYEFDLIPNCSYDEFLDRLSNNKTFIFFPQTPETLSRVIVEARMAGMSVITNNHVGATKEEWFSLKGEPLIDYMNEKRFSITSKVLEVLS